MAEAAPKEAAGEAPAESSQPALSFREHMWDQFDLLWRQRVEPTKRKLEVYVGCLRDRAQLERTYAKGLERIFNKIQLECDQGDSGIPVAMEALACNFRARIEQSTLLADEIDQDVVMTIEAMLKQHSEVARLMLADGQKLSRHWQEAQRSHDQIYARYAQVALEAEESARECMAFASLRPAEWKKYASRSMALNRHAAAVEQEYLKALQQLNSVADLHTRHMGGLLTSLQDMEEKRGQCFKDAAMKMSVHEISWVRNVQYDIDSVVQAVEASDSQLELQDFIRQHQTKARPPARVSPRLLGQGRRQVPQPAEGPSPPQLQAARDVVKPMLANCFDAHALREHIEALRLRLLHEPAPFADGMQAAGSEGSTVSWRRALCDVLKEELQESPVGLSTAAFEQAVLLFTAALDGCDRAGDAWNGRDFMVAARKIQSQPVDGRRIDVLLRVYNHPLWSRVTFWEDVLLVGITEANCQKVLGLNPNSVPGSQEVAMTSFLDGYLGYMVTLGIRTEEAQGCVQRTLRKHAQFLGHLAEAYVGPLCDAEKVASTTPGSALQPEAQVPGSSVPKSSADVPAVAPVAEAPSAPGAQATAEEAGADAKPAEKNSEAGAAPEADPVVPEPDDPLRSRISWMNENVSLAVPLNYEQLQPALLALGDQSKALEVLKMLESNASDVQDPNEYVGNMLTAYQPLSA